MRYFRLACVPPVSALLFSFIFWNENLPAGEIPKEKLRAFLESAKSKIKESDLKRLEESLGKSTRRPPRKATTEVATSRTSSAPSPEEPPAEDSGGPPARGRRPIRRRQEAPPTRGGSRGEAARRRFASCRGPSPAGSFPPTNHRAYRGDCPGSCPVLRSEA